MPSTAGTLSSNPWKSRGTSGSGLSREDRIAVVGSEPQIYFYADRQAATGYVDTYLWGPEAAGYTPRADHWLAVFQRRDAGNTMPDRGQR